MQRDVYMQILLRCRAYFPVFFNDDESKYLGVTHHCECDQHHDESIPRLAEFLLLEWEHHGDESFACHTQHQPGGHEKAHVLGEIMQFARRVAVRSEHARISGCHDDVIHASDAFRDQDEGIEDREGAEVVRVGFAPEASGLHDEEGEDVPRQTDEENERGAELEKPPSPGLLRQLRLAWSKETETSNNGKIITVCNYRAFSIQYI